MPHRVEGLFDLSGKLAVVTGARRGIGRAIAELLAAAGADIVGVSAQLEESGSEVQAVDRVAGTVVRSNSCRPVRRGAGTRI